MPLHCTWLPRAHFYSYIKLLPNLVSTVMFPVYFVFSRWFNYPLNLPSIFSTEGNAFAVGSKPPHLLLADPTVLNITHPNFLLAILCAMLTVRSLNKCHSRTPILINLNLSLQPNEILFLTGPSGCGKSTALRAIANLDVYDSGEISLNGSTPQTMGSAQWRRDVMYVSQTRIQQDCTPVELFVQALKFASRKGSPVDTDKMAGEYVALCEQVGLERAMVETQKWMELSGGTSNIFL